MKRNISLSEIENLIRKAVKERGLAAHVGDDKIEEIKKKIKHRMMGPSAAMYYQTPVVDNSVVDTDGGDFSSDMGGGLEEVDQTIEVPVDTNQDDAITQTTQVDDKTLELTHKEGEISQKERELAQKEQELNARQMELDRKAEELKYKPELPDFIKKSQPAQLFIYDQNELNMGGEGLSQAEFRTVGQPDSKKSMHKLWLEDGKVRAEIFRVEMKKIGEMEFDPMNGTSKFVEMTQPLPDDLPQQDVDMVQNAIESQEPIEPMQDAVQPITNVTLPQGTDMGLATPDIQKGMQDIIEKALLDYLMRSRS